LSHECVVADTDYVTVSSRTDQLVTLTTSIPCSAGEKPTSDF